ncbi:MAG: 3-phosphoserine/phosphohydroxythreonine transaminase [Prevotellaceae bacterium]|jgi:phosphoserine aminotransferase|nr:3-phosphoserine/phosphohydroxythreonine transaminase [Prevotellaceae bacterium]
MKQHNFGAGPCILPQQVLEATSKAVMNFNGLSVLEISHRTKDWESVMDECRSLWKELLNIPDGYQVLFLAGGASTQFMTVPYNLLEKKAAYLDTGVWASKAAKEAVLFGETVIVASSKDKNYSYIPKGWTIPSDADYFHITTNNTIYGTEIREDFDSPVNLVADMSSDIMTRKVDVAKYAMIYGGAQKNVGPAGVTFVIVREDILGKVSRLLPSMVDYRLHIKNDSMYNTPPVISIFVMKEMLKWIKEVGGIEKMEELAKQRAEILYNEIDRNPIFTGTTDHADRSYMNICFVMNEGHKDKEAAFMEFAKSRGMVGLKGHRSVGGFRASCYNALPVESVQELVKCMQEFEKNEK